MKSIQASVVAIAALTGALTLAGCSSDDASSPSSAASTAQSTKSSSAAKSTTLTSTAVAKSTTTSSAPTATTTAHKAHGTSQQPTSSSYSSSAKALPRAQSVVPTNKRSTHSQTPSTVTPKAAEEKTFMCPDIFEGTEYPCTEKEYGEVMDSISSQYTPTQMECTSKDFPATYDNCTREGFLWGMTKEQMREVDKNATCATGTMLYFAEHHCRLLPDGRTYNDGSKPL